MTVRVKPFTFTLSVAEVPGDEHPGVVAALLCALVDADHPISVALATTVESINVINRDCRERVMTSPLPWCRVWGHYAT